ncbi:MAG: PTS sugar transporter subunit IIA [Escherichia coli]|nr:PTS sugar transporter subunit IIA [Escherichia coli]
MKFEILVNDVDNSISDYQTAITFAGTQLLEKGYITAEYIDACLEREKSYPTGLMMANGQGIAIPHADYTLVVDTALTGRRLGAQHMLVVSAMGANAHSPFFYNRVKGEMEEALISQNWPKLTIARPSMLLGDRSKQRMNETLFAPLFRLLPGNWKSIDARDVARVMLAEAMRPEHEGVTILSSSELRKRAE